MPRLALPAHVHLVRAGGREYYYFQPFRGTKQAGGRARIDGCPQDPDGSPNQAWWAAYRALAGLPEPAPRAGTFAALAHLYRRSPEWAQLAHSTRRDYNRYIDIILNCWGADSVRGIEPMHVASLRDEYADIPPPDAKHRTKALEAYADRGAAANGLLRALSSMLSFGVERGYASSNPAKEVSKLAGGDGYSAWPAEAIARLREHARPELWWVAAFALYTGQRQSDVLGMLHSHVSGGSVYVKQDKTGKEMWIPLHRDLKRIADEIPRRSTHILTNSRGLPWTEDGFRASWKKDIQRRSLSGITEKRLVFHGLRKSAVVMLLEAGCTTAQVQAVTGQSMQMVEHYAAEVNQRKLASAAILRWEERGRTS